LLLGHAAERLPADSWSIKGDVVRAAAMGLATKLSELEGDMQQWLNQSRQLVLAAIQLAAPTGFDEIDATIYAETDDAQHRVESVHAVQGESVDAVMLVAEEPDADWKTPQASEWARMLDEAMTPTEEIRIFYVAVTRARRVLVLAPRTQRRS
jgi:superfamily I DNA/RNA helicase